MARIHGSVCRLCRRDGTKLFLKGSRCDTPKCAFERRDVPPGMSGARRGKLTDYGIHLREKQRLKHHYGLMERQFRRYFAMAERAKGNTGDRLLSLLERRSDNIVYRLGMAQSRAQARLMVRHGHITVNGRRVDIPSYLVNVGDVIRTKQRPRSLEYVKRVSAEAQHAVPDFLERTAGDIPEGRVLRLPEASDVSIPVQVQLVIEFCSR